MLLTGHDAMPDVTCTSHPPFTTSAMDLRAFFTLHSFLLLSRPLWGQQFILKGSRASCWSSKHSITGILFTGSIYVPKASSKVRVLQPWNLPLTGFEPVFLKVPCVNSPLSWQLGHRVLWVLLSRSNSIIAESKNAYFQ